MEQQLLNELSPIALPHEPGLWPLAIGWWLLLVALISLLALIINRVKKQRHFWAVRRKNLIVAKSLTDHHQLNRLLKQVALHYYPRHQIARLSGESWSEFLKLGLAHEHHQRCDLICGALYQKPAAVAHQDYQKIAIAWLAGLSHKTIEANQDA